MRKQSRIRPGSPPDCWLTSDWHSIRSGRIRNAVYPAFLPPTGPPPLPGQGAIVFLKPGANTTIRRSPQLSSLGSENQNMPSSWSAQQEVVSSPLVTTWLCIFAIVSVPTPTPPLVPQVLVSTSSASLHRSINISLTFIQVFLQFLCL